MIISRLSESRRLSVDITLNNPLSHLCIIGEFRVVKPPKDGNTATQRTQGSVEHSDSL